MQMLKKKGLTDVKKTEDGNLETKYFLQLIIFISELNRSRILKAKKILRDQRRKLYKNEEWDTYSLLVQENLTSQEKGVVETIREVVEALGISQQ